MYESLRKFIDKLDREGQLVRIKTSVDPVEEIAELTDRMVKNGGKALLFENTGTDFPVVTNLFGSQQRMAEALGVEQLDDIAERINSLAGGVLSPKNTFADRLAMLPLLAQASKWLPKRLNRVGHCQNVILRGDEARFDLLPVLKCWPKDGGRFITLPLVNTVDLESGVRNVGMYRMQVFDNHTTGMHWHVHKTGARHYDKYRAAGRRMPVSVCLGGDPAYTYAATAPLPEGVDEYMFAGFLRNRPVGLVRCVTNELWVPEDCDFVLEGYVDPSEQKTVEGPFGDHTGFYSLEDLYPKFHLTAITHRSDAVYPATVVGIPPEEDAYIALATEKIFLSPIRLVIQPEVRDLWMPVCGVAHNLAVVNIESNYVGQGRKVASSMWGAGQMMFNKYMLIVSTDAQIRDINVLARLLSCADMSKSLFFSEGVLDVLDHAVRTNGYGGKLAIDLTDVQVADGDAKEYELEDVVQFVFAQAGEQFDFGTVAIQADAKIVIAVDSEAEGLAFDELMWLALADSDPQRDAMLVDGRLCVDARTKLSDQERNPSRFPNVVVASSMVVESVDKRWAEYELGEFVGSPSERYRRLVKSDKAEI